MKHLVVEINAEAKGAGIEVRPRAGRKAQTSPCTLNGNDLTRLPVAA
jgi:hypothetical protein